MRNLCIKLAFALLLMTASAVASEKAPRTYSDSPNRGVELLFFRPSVEQAAFVITSSDNFFGADIHPHGRRHFNDTSYKPGFRVEATYGLNFRFTRFAAAYGSTVSGPFLFDTIGFPGNGTQSPEDTFYVGKAHINDQYNYYASDLTYNRVLLESKGDCLELLFGLHFAYIQYQSHFRSTGTFINDAVLTDIDNRLLRNSTFWGIGPQLGMDYQYHLSKWASSLRDLSLNAESRGALLCSHTSTRFKYTTEHTGSVGVNLHNNALWRVTPSIDARLGLCYDFHTKHVRGALRIGYEWLWYNKSVNSIVGYDVAFAGNSFDAYSDLSLQGPFLDLLFAF